MSIGAFTELEVMFTMRPKPRFIMIVVVGKGDVGKVTGALVAAGESVREVGVIERAPTSEADCVVENADSLWPS